MEQDELCALVKAVKFAEPHADKERVIARYSSQSEFRLLTACIFTDRRRFRCARKSQHSLQSTVAHRCRTLRSRRCEAAQPQSRRSGLLAGRNGCIRGLVRAIARNAMRVCSITR